MGCVQTSLLYRGNYCLRGKVTIPSHLLAHYVINIFITILLKITQLYGDFAAYLVLIYNCIENTVECRYNAVQCNMILHTSLHKLGQIINQRLNLQKNLWGVFHEYFGENWPLWRHHNVVRWLLLIRHCLAPWLHVSAGSIYNHSTTNFSD